MGGAGRRSPSAALGEPKGLFLLCSRRRRGKGAARRGRPRRGRGGAAAGAWRHARRARRGRSGPPPSPPAGWMVEARRPSLGGHGGHHLSSPFLGGHGVVRIWDGRARPDSSSPASRTPAMHELRRVKWVERDAFRLSRLHVNIGGEQPSMWHIHLGVQDKKTNNKQQHPRPRLQARKRAARAKSYREENSTNKPLTDLSDLS